MKRGNYIAAGFIVGGFIGFLLRPTDELVVPAAHTSFTYMLFGGIVGAIVGFLALRTKSQVSQQVRFVSSKPTPEIIQLATEILSKLGGKLSRQQNSVSTDLATDFGSQLKLRLAGGIFLSNEALPTKVTIEVQDGSENRRVFVTAEDLIRFGTTAGIGDRYKTWCAQLAERVRDDLQYRLGEFPTKNG